jgi:hypothetical protein
MSTGFYYFKSKLPIDIQSKIYKINTLVPFVIVIHEEYTGIICLNTIDKITLWN